MKFVTGENGRNPEKSLPSLILREKFYPGPGIEPGPLAFRGNVLTN